MKIDVKRDFYFEFYKLLHAKYLLEVGTERDKKAYKNTLSDEVWEIFPSKVTTLFAGANGKCPQKYFYSKYLFFKPKKKEEDAPQNGEMDRLTLIKALTFIWEGKGLQVKIKRRKPASEEQGKIEFDIQTVELKFSTFQATGEWGQINNDDTANILVEAFRQQYMPTTVPKNSKPAIQTEPSTILEILDIEESEFHKYNIGKEEKEILYKYIFDFSASIERRKYAVRVFTKHKILTDDEILNILNIQNFTIRRFGYAYLHELFGEHNDKYNIMRSIFTFVPDCRDIFIINRLVIYTLYFLGDKAPRYLYRLIHIEETYFNDNNGLWKVIMEDMSSYYYKEEIREYDYSYRDDVILLLEKCHYKSKGNCQDSINDFFKVIKEKNKDFYDKLVSISIERSKEIHYSVPLLN